MNDESVVLPVRCENDECGMESAFRFWKDGSYKKVFEACWHPKRMPSLPKISAAIADEKAGKN